MDAPQIRYARTSDGVNIAYCVLGEGPPLVYASNIWGDVHTYTHRGATGLNVDHVVRAGRKVVRYDLRCTGSSDRTAPDRSLAARVRDLEAVADALALERFDLCGFGHGGPTALMYAAQHSERVADLAIINSYASGAAYYAKIPAMRALTGLQGMAEEQWEFFTLTLASASGQFGDTDLARQTAAMWRDSMTAVEFLAFVEESRKIDLAAVLPTLITRTLVVADTAIFGGVPELSRELAAAIPGATFVASDDHTRELLRFLGGTPAAAEGSGTPTGTAIILFLDIVDSTALTERMGDAAFRSAARTLDERMRKAISSVGGTLVEGKTLGDGVLATFASARQAVDAAQRCNAISAESELRLHLGLHAGDVIREDNNVYGGAVNIAARISGLSAPGEILVSATVRELARTSAGVTFEDAGEREMKGVGEPVRVYRVVA